MRDEEAPLFDDYARPSRGSDNKKTVIGVLSALLVVLLVALGVVTYLWQHQGGMAPPMVTTSSGMGFQTTGAQPQTSAAPYTTTGANPNPAATTTNTMKTTQLFPTPMPWKTGAPTKAPQPTPAAATVPPTPQPTNAQGYPAAWDAVAQQVLSSMNFSASPCDDFYNYACGGWLANNTIPADRSRWSRAFSSLGDAIEKVEQEIATGGWPLISTFYDACLDVAALDAAGVNPLLPLLNDIQNVNDKGSLTNVLSKFHLLGVGGLFSFGTGADDFHPAVQNAQFDQGGLHLPVEYYSSNATSKVKVLQAYQNYIQTVFALLPAPFNANPGQSAAAVITFEKALASISMTPQQRRDPASLYNKLTLDELENITQTVDFHQFVQQVGVPARWNTSDLNVGALNFFTLFDTVVDPLMTTLPTLRDILAVKYALSRATVLSKPFRDAAFAFKSVISGVSAAPKRAVECVRALDSDGLGMAVGHVYVSQLFQSQVKAATAKLVEEVEAAFGKRLNDVKWLNNATRNAAKKKLSQVTNQIGYPENWPKYTHLTLTSSHFENIENLARLSARKSANKLGKPTDKMEFGMLPQQVNAYYDPTKNQIVFPAGILQGSFYNFAAPGALNYGGIGGVIGHELSHGFDDQGRQYNGEGARVPWWPKDVIARFKNATDCLVNVYGSFNVTVINGTAIHENPHLCLGENLADTGGIANSYRAYVARLAAEPAFAAVEAMIPKAFNGLTNDQLFFVAWGQNWCTLQRPAALEHQLATDPHSPGILRTLGPISQTPPSMFQAAFKCPTGSLYAPADKCHIW